MKKLRRVIYGLTVAIAAAAVVDQLRRPESERTWHGDVLGVPYDFRPPSLGRVKNAWWNPDDSRLFTPRDFGVGWVVNLYRLKELIEEQMARRQEAGGSVTQAE